MADIVPRANEYELGLQYYNKRQYIYAFACFSKISLNQKHPQYLAACLRLWRMYEFGQGTMSINFSKSEGYRKIVVDKIDYFRQQAEAGVPGAKDNLAMLHEQGRVTERNYIKLATACVPDADAQYNLAILYDEGHIVAQDYGKARHWYEQAAAQGSAAAQNGLGKIYCDGHGIMQDYGKAWSWYEKAAVQGYKPAQVSINLMYTRGQCKNEAQALTYFEKVVAKGYYSALEVADIYGYLGTIEPQRQVTCQHALLWYAKARKTAVQVDTVPQERRSAFLAGNNSFKIFP